MEEGGVTFILVFLSLLSIVGFILYALEREDREYWQRQDERHHRMLMSSYEERMEQAKQIDILKKNMWDNDPADWWKGN